MLREPLLQPQAEPLVLLYMRALGHTTGIWDFLSGVAEQANNPQWHTEGDCRLPSGQGREDKTPR